MADNQTSGDPAQDAAGSPEAATDLTPPKGPGKRRALLVAAAVALAVFLVGLSALRTFDGEDPGGGRGSQDASSLIDPATGLPRVRLEIPSLDVVAGLSTITMRPGRVLEPPANVHAVGRWDLSADYGSTTGRTVLTGHTVYNGGGALGPLPKLKTGEIMRVVTPEGTFEYRTTSVEVRSKAWVRQNGVDVFKQPGGDGSLVVVTCTDYDGRDYRSNVIAIAEPVYADDADAESA